MFYIIQPNASNGGNIILCKRSKELSNCHHFVRYHSFACRIIYVVTLDNLCLKFGIASCKADIEIRLRKYWLPSKYSTVVCDEADKTVPADVHFARCATRNTTKVPTVPLGVSQKFLWSNASNMSVFPWRQLELSCGEIGTELGIGK